MEEKSIKNLRYDILNDKCISTIYRPVFISYAGYYTDSWETFVWNWNNEKREKWVGEHYHHSQKQALKFHMRLLKIYSYLQSRKFRKEKI